MTPADKAEEFVNIWACASLICGPILIFFGARAGGVAVLASLVGAFARGFVATSDFDFLPHGLSIGASTGLVVGGLIGLFWKSPAKRTTLAVLGGLVAVLGVALVLATHLLEEQMCFYSHGGTSGYASCLPTAWDSLVQVLVAFSAALSRSSVCCSRPIHKNLRTGRTSRLPDDVSGCWASGRAGPRGD